MKRRQAVELTWQFSKRDVLGRYRGSFLGLGWSLVAPLLMLSLYTFVFSTILQARWPGIESESSLLYATNLFAGLIIINFISEVATKASTLIIGHANYVKRVVFPLEILGVSTVLSAAFHSAISIGLLLVFQLIATGSLSWSILSLPLVATHHHLAGARLADLCSRRLCARHNPGDQHCHHTSAVPKPGIFSGVQISRSLQTSPQPQPTGVDD